MTVSTTENRAQAQGDNSTVDFDFNFKTFLETDLTVYKSTRATGVTGDALTINVDYTVAISAVTGWSVVTYTVAPTTLQDSLILREVPLTQATSYPVESNLPEKTFENSLDKLTMITQQQEEQIGRSIKLPVSSDASDISIPNPSAGKALLWNDDEDALINSTDDFDDIVTDAETAQTGAETAESNASTSAAASASSASDSASSATDSATSAAEAAASAAGVNLPSAGAGDALKLLQVNAGETGYELTPTVDTNQIAADAIDGTKIEDSAVDTEHITADAVDDTKIADDAVQAEHISGFTGTGDVDTDNIPEGVVKFGKVLQMVYTQSGALDSGTTTIPFDDTIPQNTEGDEYMTLAITPVSATSLLVIDFTGYFGSSADGQPIVVALFQDSTASALKTAMESPRFQTTVGQNSEGVRHVMVSGTTSETTFKIRAGMITNGTCYLNGDSGGRNFGGTYASGMTITEYAT